MGYGGSSDLSVGAFDLSDQIRPRAIEFKKPKIEIPKDASVDEIAEILLGKEEIKKAEEAAKREVDEFFKREDQQLKSWTSDIESLDKALRKANKDLDNSTMKLYDSFESMDEALQKYEKNAFDSTNKEIDKGKEALVDANKKLDEVFGGSVDLDKTIDEFASRKTELVEETTPDSVIPSSGPTVETTQYSSNESSLSSLDIFLKIMIRFHETLSEVLSIIGRAYENIYSCFCHCRD